MKTRNLFEPAATVVAALIVAACYPAAAQEMPGLTLPDAVRAALAQHPSLAEAGATRNVAAAKRYQLAQTSPWTLGLEVENIVGSGDFAGLDAAETTLMLERTVERGDKPALRGALGDADVALAEDTLQTLRLDVAAEAALAFTALLAAQERLEVDRGYAQLTLGARDAIGRLVRVGRSAEAELATAEITLARAQAEMRQSEFALRKRRGQLAALMGARNAAAGGVTGDLYAKSRLPNPAQARAKLAQHPRIRRYERLAQRRSAQRRLAEAERQTDLTFGAGLRHLAGPDDAALVLSIEMPLGQRARAKPGVDVADAREAVTPKALANERFTLEAELDGLFADIEAAAQELAALQERVIPLAEQAVSLYQAGFDRGRYSLFELFASQQSLIRAERDQVAAGERYQTLVIRLRALIGEVPGHGEST